MAKRELTNGATSTDTQKNRQKANANEFADEWLIGLVSTLLNKPDQHAHETEENRKISENWPIFPNCNDNGHRIVFQEAEDQRVDRRTVKTEKGEVNEWE